MALPIHSIQHSFPLSVVNPQALFLRSLAGVCKAGMLQASVIHMRDGSNLQRRLTWNLPKDINDCDFSKAKLSVCPAAKGRVHRDACSESVQAVHIPAGVFQLLVDSSSFRLSD